MHERTKKQQGDNRDSPRKLAERVGRVGDPVKSNQSQSELGYPSGPKRFFGCRVICNRKKPEGRVTKDHRPRWKRNVTGADQNACQEGPTKFVAFLLEKLNPSLHHGISNTKSE